MKKHDVLLCNCYFWKLSVFIHNEADIQTKNKNYTKYTKKIECILYIYIYVILIL